MVVVPASAVLSTGQRHVVWVQKDEGVFEPRLVKLGVRAGDSVQILDGIKEGEIVVSSGGYLIDSESQLQTASSATAAEHAGMKMQNKAGLDARLKPTNHKH